MDNLTLPAPGTVPGIDTEMRDIMEALLGVSASVSARNRTLRNYYEGDFDAPSIGVGTIPESVNVASRCDWPRKAVTSVSERSRMTGFVFDGGYNDETMQKLVNDGLLGAYNRNVPNELVHGCMFATVHNTPRGVRVSFHTAETAVAIWDYENDCPAAGMVVANMAPRPGMAGEPIPTQVNVYLPGRIGIFKLDGPARWRYESLDTPIARPQIEAFCFRPSGIKPFGETRITQTVRDYAHAVMRTLDDMAVSAAFYAHPQKYLLGIPAKNFDAMVDNKQAQLVNAMLMMTADPKTGEVPKFGQLAAVSPQPYIDMLRAYAAMFSGSTGVPLNSLGIIQDNPSSAQAIQAAREDICIAAEDLNDTARTSMRNVALMAMAVAGNTTIEGLSEVQASVMPTFADPSKPSVVSQADAMVKVATADSGFAGTSVFYEGLGFDQATIRRIKTEEAKSKAGDVLTALLAPKGAANDRTSTAGQLDTGYERASETGEEKR